MRLLSPEHYDALIDPQTWSDNPFVKRDLRREVKRKQPFKAFVWMCAVLFVIVELAWWGLHTIYAHGYGNPWYLGDGMGASLCIVLSGVHIYYILGAAQKNTVRMLIQEVLGNTLSSLLLLPMSPFQMLLQALIFPWLAAMRAAILLLPLYAFCVGCGGVSWLDVGMLYLVFALCAVSLPRWARPALNENTAIAVSSPAAEAEAARAAGQEMANQQVATALQSGSAPGQWVSVAFLLPFFAMLSGRGISSPYNALHPYLPDSIQTLLPSSIFSWPLLMARGLITPFDWFGWAVPPLPFVLVGFVLARYTQLVRIAEYLSVGAYRDLAALPTYLPRRRLEGWLKMGQALVLTGYLWKVVVRDGAMNGWVAQSGPSGAPGLFVFLTGLLLVTLWMRGMGRAGALALWQREAVEGPSVQERAVRRVSVRSAARFLLEPFAFAGAYYLICCGLSRTAPFPPGVCALAGKMLAIGLAGMLLRYAATRALGFFAIMGALILPLVCYAPSETWILAPFSPLLGLYLLVRPGLFGFGPLVPLRWWHWVVACGGLGLILTLATGLLALLGRRRRRPEAAPSAMALDPTIVGGEVFADGALTKAKETTQRESPLARSLISGVQRCYDNAVTIKELRARLRGKLDTHGLQRMVAVFIGITLLLGYGLPMLAQAFGGGIAHMLFSEGTGSGGVIWASVLGCWYIGLMFTALGAGFSVLGQAFSREREKSTLGFLLATPMRASAIVWGKAIGLLLAGGMSSLILLAWTLGLSVALSPLLGGLAVALTAWIEVALTALAVGVSVGMLALAVASLFPRLATAKVSGCLGGALFYAVILIPQIAFRQMVSLQAYYSIDGYTAWLLFLGSCAAFTLLTALIAIWGVGRMRRTDVSFTESRQIH